MDCAYCGKPEHRHICFSQAKWVTENAVADPEKLHQSVQMGLTTNPRQSNMFVALMWMQREPRKWEGFHTERCTEVAQVFGMVSED